MTLSYRCSNCGTELMTSNAGPLHDYIERLRKELEGAKVALTECANIIRPKLPSLADNVIGAHVRSIEALLSS